MSLPVIYTPITKLQLNWENTQGGPCGNQYMDFMRCASRTGMEKAKYECKNELADFHECLRKGKQLERVKIMNAERKRQKRPPIEPLAKDIPERGY
ncbi:uncharacterized protein LOC106064376 isoform X2 [Biomphalaria glabrata]|nr:uncharacterized protein LOC106064376 isoform X2 [Biomphalaria glabrata]